MVREIVLDTETTGLDPSTGDRLVEIGCLELVNHVPTGRVFHTYINPEREVPEGAYRVHGLSYAFLKDHPTFKEVSSLFLSFIQEEPLVIHNAKFDLKFLNAELKVLKLGEIPHHRAIDTLTIARKKFPGSPASLDALCKRFGIDNGARDKHGALIDAELLAQVYVELLGGKQRELLLNVSSGTQELTGDLSQEKKMRDPRPHLPTQEELDLHQALLKRLAI